MDCRWWLVCLCFAAVTDRTQQNYLMDCKGVRRLLQLQQIDATGVRNTPEIGSDLQVCHSRSMTCCTRKVEERYQTAVRQDIRNLLQTFSYNLKLLITQNIVAIQDAVDFEVREVQSQTFLTLKGFYGDQAWRASSPLNELFTDIRLFVLGAELNMEEAAHCFFEAMFPLVHDQLDGAGDPSSDFIYQECVRSVGHHAAVYGNAPARLASLVLYSSLAERTFLQSLHLAVEVINTTDHVQPSKECHYALLRMRYCPLCQDLIDTKPCMGYCLNVLRGCLASLAEVNHHWQEFVRSLESHVTRMHDENKLEHGLASVSTLIADALASTSKNAARLTSQIRGVCGKPVHSKSVQQGVATDTEQLKTPERNTGDNLNHRRQEFLSSLRHYRAFYGGLADQMCVRELASTDGPTCWNGTGVVKSYTKRVVGSGIRAQAQNPEVRVKEADPVINQVIDKLKHINQILQGHFIPKLGTLDQIEMGSGDLVVSGHSDDEDDCWGSGDEKPGIITPPELREEKLSLHTQSAGRTLATSGCSSTHSAVFIHGAVCALLVLWR